MHAVEQQFMTPSHSCAAIISCMIEDIITPAASQQIDRIIHLYQYVAVMRYIQGNDFKIVIHAA